MHGWVGRWMDGWMDGCMNGTWMDGWVDGWIREWMRLVGAWKGASINVVTQKTFFEMTQHTPLQAFFGRVVAGCAPVWRQQ